MTRAAAADVHSHASTRSNTTSVEGSKETVSMSGTCKHLCPRIANSRTSALPFAPDCVTKTTLSCIRLAFFKRHLDPPIRTSRQKLLGQLYAHCLWIMAVRLQP